MDVIRALLNAGADVSARDSAGGTALHAAASRGLLEASRMLLQAGSDGNAVDMGTNTPLHRLGAAGVDGQTSSDLASLLLEWGASLEIKNSEGLTPVSAALASRNRPLVLAYRDFLGDDQIPSTVDDPGSHSNALLEAPNVTLPSPTKVGA